MNLRSAQGCAGRKKNGGTAVTGWGVRGTARRIAVESSRPDKARGPRSDLINLETRERRAPVRNSTPVAGLPPPPPHDHVAAAGPALSCALLSLWLSQADNPLTVLELPPPSLPPTTPPSACCSMSSFANHGFSAPLSILSSPLLSSSSIFRESANVSSENHRSS